MFTQDNVLETDHCNSANIKNLYFISCNFITQKNKCIDEILNIACFPKKPKFLNQKPLWNMHGPNYGCTNHYQGIENFKSQNHNYSFYLLALQ